LVDVLREIAASPSGWETLAACPIRELARGDILLHAGQANDRMHFVLDGLLSVRLIDTGSEPENVIEAGGTVGELSVIDQKPATAFVVAEKPTRLLTMTGEVFWKFVDSFPAFSRHVITTITGHARRSTLSLTRSLGANQQLEASALVDSLTGVFNRRWLDNRADRLLLRAELDKAPLALFMLDIDLFKKFNDTWGHPAGDAVLVAVAQATVACVRPTDFVVRYGGEEFLVLLPATTLAEARDVAERARVAVSEVQVRGIDGTPLPRVTISLGVVERGSETQIGPLLARADALLYAAKRNGRNRVET
jgi:diguanylate cyclase (GGDEF)-like protein